MKVGPGSAIGPSGASLEIPYPPTKGVVMIDYIAI